MADTLRAKIDRRKFTILLAALLVMILLPVVRGTAEGRGASALLWGVVLLAAVHAASGRPRVTAAFAAGAIVVFGGRLATLFGGGYNPVEAGGYASAAVFLAATVYIVFRGVVHSPRISADTVMGAVCVYLLIGLMWTNFYALVHLAEPAAFRFPEYAEPTADIIAPERAFAYYSFVTLTTLGYGDITPITFRARTLSWLEAVVGVTYMATVIAFLVSQIFGRRETRSVSE
jgi:hypothetical protein